MNLDLFIFGLFSLTFLLVGYAIGQGKLSPESLQELKKKIAKKLDTTPVGLVHRPSAKQLATWADPKKAQEEEAMIEDLKKIPELNV